MKLENFNEQNLFDLIESVVYEVTGVKKLTLDTSFVQDLGLSSFDVANIVSIFEERFNIEVPVRDIWELNLVKDVVDYMMQMQNRLSVE